MLTIPRKGDFLEKALEIAVQKNVKSSSNYILQTASKSLPDLKHEDCFEVSK